MRSRCTSNSLYIFISVYTPFRRLTIVVASGVLTLLTPIPGQAQQDFWSAVNASRQLFEVTDYPQALTQIEQAKPLAQSDDQRATVSLYEGLILATLGQRNRTDAISAFREGLLLAPWARLPDGASEQVQHLFEEVRNSVRTGLSRRDPGVPGPSGSPSRKNLRENFGSVLQQLQKALEDGDYSQSLQLLERCEQLIRHKEQNVTLALYKGVILANMGHDRISRAASAFREGLLHNHRAKLPVKSSASVERGLEEIRARVINELASRPQVPPEDKSRWKATGSMVKERESHTATLLPSGNVLVAGGLDSSGTLSEAELYNPREGTWSATDGMGTGRYHHTATLLRTGLVLVVGGENYEEGVLSSAELYDPNKGTWSSAGSISTGRQYHTAILLPSGHVLVAGGEDSSGEKLSSAEIYDPATGLWTATSSMSTDRIYHEAVLLPSGRVLVMGGISNTGYTSSAEEYVPDQKKWVPSQGNLPLAVSEHRATLLRSGRILLTGGDDGSTGQPATAIYTPATGTFSPGSAPMNIGRVAHTATELTSGNVLVTGGEVTDKPSPINAEVYNVITGQWTPTTSMLISRDRYTATLLPSGEVLIAGGSHEGTPLNSSELYQP